MDCEEKKVETVAADSDGGVGGSETPTETEKREKEV